MSSTSSYPSSLVDALKSVVADVAWQRVGLAADLRRKRCHKLFAEDGEHLVLVHVSARDAFYALEASCAHEGGPLEEGDLEDAGDKWVLVCPWHQFEFDVGTGLNSLGLSQKVFPVRVVDDAVYVHSPELLSLTPFPDASSKANDNDDVKLKAQRLVRYLKGQCSDQEKRSATISEAPTPDVDDAYSRRSLEAWAVRILNTPDPHEKVRLTDEVAKLWHEGNAPLRTRNEEEDERVRPPETPRRMEALNVVAPEKIKRGKGGTLASRIALLHSLANIEQWAIDLSWDVIARFSAYSSPSIPQLPDAFFTDFIRVAVEEAKHFRLLDHRLRELDSRFGALPVHDALWQSARDTNDSLLARLAIVHMVHEARGLDVHPQTRRRFAAAGDDASVATLDVIFRDEITHVEAGLTWFTYVCRESDPILPPVETFHDLVRKYFKGYLKPPFNAEARESAGMTEEWYLPLVKRTEEINLEDKK